MVMIIGSLALTNAADAYWITPAAASSAYIVVLVVDRVDV